MPKYVEYIKVGTDESWQVRDPDAHTSISTINENIEAIQDKIDEFEGHTHPYLPTAGGTLSGDITRSATTGMPTIKTERTDTGISSSLAVDSAGVLHGLRTWDNWMLYASWTHMYLGNKPFCLYSSHYGTDLPAAGTAGRIFFKKV